MNKTLLNNKLKSYSAIAGAVVAGSSAANAQIVYTDVNPDSVLTVANGTLSEYDVDFDGDANIDVAVATYGYLYGSYQINYSLTFIPGTSAVLAATGTYGGEITGLSSGSAIDPMSTSWMDTTANGGGTFFNLATINGTPAAGTMATGVDQCIGVRFMVGTNTHYGWVRIQLASDLSTTTVKDYAYKTAPNTGLNCGETGLGIAEMPSTQWFAGTKGNTIVVSAKVDGDVTVIDAAGRLVANGQVVNGTASITVENAQAGMYIVNFTSNAGSGSKKVVLN